MGEEYLVDLFKACETNNVNLLRNVQSQVQLEEVTLNIATICIKKTIFCNSDKILAALIKIPIFKEAYYKKLEMFKVSFNGSIDDINDISMVLLAMNKMMFEKAKTGTQTDIQELVNFGLNPAYDKSIALRIACGYGNLNVVKYLVEQCEYKANIADCNYGAIRFACKNGQTNVVKYLISKWPDVINSDCYKLAKDFGNYDLIQYLDQYFKDSSVCTDSVDCKKVDINTLSSRPNNYRTISQSHSF